MTETFTADGVYELMAGEAERLSAELGITTQQAWTRLNEYKPELFLAYMQISRNERTFAQQWRQVHSEIVDLLAHSRADKLGISYNDAITTLQADKPQLMQEAGF